MDRDQSEPVIQLSLFQLACMREIREQDDPSGQDLRRALEEVYPEHVPNNRVYENVRELVERELVLRGCVNDRTNWYRLTEKGQEEYRMLLDWLN